MAKRNTDIILRLINQILDFRKIQNDKMKVLVEQVDIIQMCIRDRHHTHEGSIGNLCNDRIENLMQQVVDGFNFSVMEQAEQSLLGR